MSSLDNISALLDANLDDLADKPEFVTPPSGAYNVTVQAYAEKQIGEHPAIELKLQFNATLELANPTDTPVADNTESSISFMLDNEYGVGDLKAFLAPVKVATGTTSVRETLDAVVGMQLMVVTKNRMGKKGTSSEDKTFLGITKVEVI